MKMPGRFAAGLVGLALMISGCSGTADSVKTDKPDRKRVKVAAAIYPLADFAAKIGGEHVEVVTLTPPGAEPHDFEPTPRDLEKLHSSDVFIYNGAGIESWADRIGKSLDSRKTVILNATEGLPLMKAAEDEHGHGGEGEAHGVEGNREEEHHAEEWDPHVWMDPALADKQAARIRDALVQADPEHRSDYEFNYRKLSEKLGELDRKLSESVRKAKKKEIVVSHAAFGYLCKRYGLEQIPVSGLSPIDEPGPKAVEEIIHVMKEHEIRHLFFETVANGKVAETIRKETGAEALTLHPLEALTPDEIKRGEDYFSIMNKNLENLEKGLQVKQ